MIRSCRSRVRVVHFYTGTVLSQIVGSGLKSDLRRVSDPLDVPPRACIRTLRFKVRPEAYPWLNHAALGGQYRVELGE